MLYDLVKLELLKSFRNRRFLIFTVLMPAFFIIVLSKIDNNFSKGLSSVNLFYICSMYGMFGNNIVTFSTKVSKEKNFYLGIFKTTKLNIVQYTFAQFIAQSILNGIIMLILLFVGYFILNLRLSSSLCFGILLVYIFSSIFAFLGAFLGYLFDPVSLQVISNPLYMGLTILSMPASYISFFPDFIKSIYYYLPGQLLWKLIFQIENTSSINMIDFLGLFSYLLLFICGISGLLYARQQFAVTRGS